MPIALCLALLFFRAPISAQTLSELDRSFLRSPPYERQKLAVDLDTVTKESDLHLIKDAIQDIIVFVYSTREYSWQTSDRFTNDGIINFQSTPKIVSSEGQTITLLPLKQYAWEVTESQEIKLTADYGLREHKARFSQRMVFKKIEGRWRFDRYEWRKEK